MKKNIFFFCSFVCSFAAPVELCVSFECENCYSIRVQKIETLEKKQWSLSDSVACECGMWLPPSFEIKNLPGNYLSGVGGGCVAFEKKKKNDENASNASNEHSTRRYCLYCVC